MTGVAAVVVAAGVGERADLGIPKQYAIIGGQPMLRWSVAVLAGHERIGSVVVVVAPEHEPSAVRVLEGIEGVVLVRGGSTRRLSVCAGIDYLESECPDHVLVHDAARPGLDFGHIDEILDAFGLGHVAVAPALPVSDSVVRSQGDQIFCELRSGLMRVQTPQGFCYSALRRVLSEGSGFSDSPDEVSLMCSRGAKIHLTSGDQRLNKVTVADDVLTVQRHLAGAVVRVGTGFDVHAFGPGDHVMLCGVRIDHDRSLRGHSDADVGWHALTDALFGALAAGDLGEHFPSSDPRWLGADSSEFLSFACDMVTGRGYGVVNVDLTLICASPKLAPWRQAMCDSTSRILGIPSGRISIKATTTDGLGAAGRDEGIIAQAIVGLGWR